MLIDAECSVKVMDVIELLQKNDIESRPLWKPMHSQPVFADAKYVTVDNVSVSEELFSKGFCLPSDSKMSLEDVERVCDVIRTAFKGI